MWTKAQMVEVWGARCEDYEEDCACCLAWSMFDEIERLRETLGRYIKAVGELATLAVQPSAVTKSGS